MAGREPNEKSAPAAPAAAAPSASTPNSSPVVTAHLATSKTIDQGIAEIREAANAKKLAIDLTEVKPAAGRRLVLRAKGSTKDCTAFRALLGEVKAPPDCLVALCLAEGEVLWNQIGANAAWTDIGTTE